MQKINQAEIRVEKVIKRKCDKLYVKLKGFDNIGLIKKIALCKMSCFPEPYTCTKNKIKVKLDISNYATKFDLKGTTEINTSKFAKKVDLTSLKLDIDKLGIGKLQTTLV